MARVNNSSAGVLTGKVGEVVYYQVNGVTYARKSPAKRTKSQKSKVSPRAKRNLGSMALTQKYLKNLTPVIAIGFQQFRKGARSPYHACVSYTKMNCFVFDGDEMRIDPALVLMSKGDLVQPDNMGAERKENGIRFTWKDNSWNSNSKPDDKAFVVLKEAGGTGLRWEEVGSSRDKEEFFYPLSPSSTAIWHVYLAFSRLNPYTKIRTFSNSTYLGKI